HVSTDEVYGSLASDAPAFTEDHVYEPNSPYSASKAASDHLVRAWHHTDGLQVRDWLYVGDHCSAIREVLARGRVGETYNIGGWNEKPNRDIVHTVCALLDE